MSHLTRRLVHVGARTAPRGDAALTFSAGGPTVIRAPICSLSAGAARILVPRIDADLSPSYARRPLDCLPSDPAVYEAHCGSARSGADRVARSPDAHPNCLYAFTGPLYPAFTPGRVGAVLGFVEPVSGREDSDARSLSASAANAVCLAISTGSARRRSVTRSRAASASRTSRSAASASSAIDGTSLSPRNTRPTRSQNEAPPAPSANFFSA